MAVLYSTDFTGSNGAAWPTGWTQRNSGSIAIQGNRGRMNFPASYSRVSAQYTNQFSTADLEYAGALIVPGAGFAQVILRSNANVDTGQGYCFEMLAGSNSLTLNRRGTQASADYSVTDIASHPMGLTLDGNALKVKFRVATEGTRVVLSIKTWLASGSEPGSFTNYYDTSADRITSQNYLGLSAFEGSAGYLEWDDVTVADLAATSTSKLYMGTTAPSNYYVGTTAASKLMVGTTQVWP